MKKKYEQTEKCTLKNIADCCTGCNEAKAEYFDFYYAYKLTNKFGCLVEQVVPDRIFKILTNSPKRIKWLRENDFIKEVFELLPCPFCGGIEGLEVIDESKDIDSNHIVVCNRLNKGCGAQSKYSRTCDGAVKEWNTRK